MFCSDPFELAANPSPAAEPNPAAPDWQLADIDGMVVSLADLKGKIVILDFWASGARHTGRRFPALSHCKKSTKTEAWLSLGSRLMSRSQCG
jgi:hypothetical protein